MQIGRQQTLVLGPPGCGKTTDLLTKVESCLEQGIKPERIAFVSFTKKAVAEAKERAIKKFGLKDEQLPYFKTIHSLCFMLLECSRADIMGSANYRELGDMLGYQFEGTFDESETGLPVGGSEGDKLLFMDNFARVTMQTLRDAWQRANADVDWFALERLSVALARYKGSNGLLDFTDLLTKVIQRPFKVDVDVAFIDEAQDLSLLQWNTLRTLFENCPQTYIAGDDDQSIYKWSGADVDTFLNLPGKREILNQSYRLPRRIHTLSNTIIRRIGRRLDKPYHPRPTDGFLEFAQSLEYVDFAKEESTMLCLARNVFLLAHFTRHLRTQGVPYIMRGNHNSVKAAHIEAILTWEALRKGEQVTARSAKRMYEQMKIGDYLKRGAKTSIMTEPDGIKLDANYLKSKHGLKKLDIWHDALENIEVEQREYYLAMLRAGRKITGKPRVIVNTIHGVKGGEADHVVILSDMSYRTYQEYQKEADNEHRVSYVGVTRAKERLTVVQPASSFAYRY